MRYTTRPLSDRTWLRPASKRQQSRFDSTWSSTLELLERELTALKAHDVVLEVDVPERAVRLDGQLRADAKAETPAVVVAFESKHGPLLYRCDQLVVPYWKRGEHWQHNVRAIALTLEALRAVDRYGATQTGQQYTGWAAIGSTPFVAGAGPAQLTEEQAWAALYELAGSTATHGDSADRIISLARRRAHPDTGGSTETWLRFEAAVKVVRP